MKRACVRRQHFMFRRVQLLSLPAKQTLFLNSEFYTWLVGQGRFSCNDYTRSPNYNIRSVAVRMPNNSSKK